MERTYHDPESQITVSVIATMYLDWGLEITNEMDETIYYNPSCLDRECYGFHWEDDDDNPLEEGIEWTEAEWTECLRNEFDDLVDAYVWED